MRSPAVGILLLALVSPAAAQTPSDVDETTTVAAVDAQPERLGTPSTAPQSQPFFKSLGNDYRTFFTSTDTARTMAIFGAGALSVSKWDATATRTAHANWSGDVFGPGDRAGELMAHVAFAGGTYAIGRLSGHSQVERVGSSLLRAQILSQSVVQAVKFTTGRTRPDGSDQQSFPSGHTASAFATATVLQRELGWKIGVPAYAFAAWVGASRMEANKHYMSDVLLGAGVGIASARAVTVPVGRQKFALGVAPASGGAAVTFTRQ